MRIDRVTLRMCRKHLITPFNASSHGAQELNHILVLVEGNGQIGWGECSAPNDPYYMGETCETAWHILKDFLVPPILHREWRGIEELVALTGPVKANTFAKAGLEMACWDLLGRSTGRSASELLGGTREEILSGVSLGIEQQRARLLELITRHLEEGYRRVKIKVAPGMDVEVVADVRAAFPRVPLMVDANSAYTLADVPHLAQFDAFDLTMIEQPLAWDDILDHRELQRAIKTPVCLDESIRSVDDARRAVQMESCRVINVKIGRLGGLLEARRVHDHCFAHGIPLWVGGMHDYGVGRAANIAVASLPGIGLPGDISGSNKYFVEDIIDPPIVATGGAVAVPKGPGLGVNVVEERVRAITVRELTLS